MSTSPQKIDEKNDLETGGLVSDIPDRMLN